MFGRTNKDFITVKDVPAEAFIKALANHLKSSQKVTPIENAEFIKTGFFKNISPNDEDWFYTRTAALARKIYLRPGLGVKNLQHIYGGKNRRTTRGKRHHAKGSGKVLRYALNQLLDANILMRYNDKRNNNYNDNNHKDKNYPKILTPNG